MELFDSHTHLDHRDFDEDREEMIARARAAGVTRMLCVGPSDGIESSRRAVNLAETHEGVWASVGIHPHDCNRPFEYSELETLAKHPKVVAFGEIGLDFYRDWCPFDIQEKHFHLQLDLALSIGKPLIIHSRNAGEKCLEILEDRGAEAVGGVFHCYSEDAEFAERIGKMGFLVSFPGSLTFKNAEGLRDVARKLPLDRILIETDAPFLAPVPHRGKRCESAWLLETAKTLASLKGLPIEKVAEITTMNAVRLFRL